MPLVTTAAAAVVFAARHDQFEIHLGDHGIGQGLPEARPTGTAVELGLGAEQRQSAAGTDERATAMLLIERTGEGALGTFTTQHRIGGGTEPLFPFSITEIPGRIKGLGSCIRASNPEKGDQGNEGATTALQQLADEVASGMEHHRLSAHPAGAENDGQHQKDGQEAPADAVEGVLGAAGAGEHGATAGGQAAHAVTLGAVQQNADDHQDAAEHPDGR